MVRRGIVKRSSLHLLLKDGSTSDKLEDVMRAEAISFIWGGDDDGPIFEGWLENDEHRRRVYEYLKERLIDDVGSEQDEEAELKRAISTFSTDVGDFDVVKAGWQLGVKEYGKRRKVAGIVGYEEWPGYVGVGRDKSLKINDWLWEEAFLRKRFNLDALVSEMVEKFGLEKSQAERIVRTEMANIFNKAREWAYLNETEVFKFIWVANDDACEKCIEVERRMAKGVSLDELKATIRDVGGEYAREWTVHPECRCTFVRKVRPRKAWEKV